MKLCITDIQRFCLHDGPGIRTTVFLKGCQLQCPWCCNPETQSIHPQTYIDTDKCMYPICPNCENSSLCPAMQQIGRKIEVDECLKECLRDRNYYQGGGGVTFSGGEPLLQTSVLVQVLQRLKEEHITICVETSLYASLKQLQRLLPYVDIWYVDLKSLEPERIRALGGQLTVYLENFIFLYQHCKHHLILRIPLVKPYTFTDTNKKNILSFFQHYRFVKVELFSAHMLAEKKYRLLQQTHPAYEAVTEDELRSFAQAIAQEGQIVEVIHI